MTLLSKDEVTAIRERAAQLKADAKRYGPIHPEPVLQNAADVLRLLEDLAASPPLIVIAPEGASMRERAEIMSRMAEAHRGPVYVLPFGWCEANDEQRETLARRIRHVEQAAREECARTVEAMADVFEAPEIAKTIRALNDSP